LLNKNSIPIANHIKINPNWTPEQLEALSKMITNAVYAALLELGVNAEKLSFNHNDILYEGKKFMGYEQLTSNGVFSEDIVITLEYSPEKEIFQRLTGKYALTRGITGIIEETQCFTKQQFIEKLLEKIIAFTKTLA
jgi:lipoate-protein ligase A